MVNDGYQLKILVPCQTQRAIRNYIYQKYNIHFPPANDGAYRMKGEF